VLTSSSGVLTQTNQPVENFEAKMSEAATAKAPAEQAALDVERTQSDGLHIREAFEATREEIENTPPLDIQAAEVMELLLTQLIADPGNPTATPILPHLDLGRAGDTIDPSYALVVCATAAHNLNQVLSDSSTVLQLPIVTGTDVGIESFRHERQVHLHMVLRQIHKHRADGLRVLVCCQQGMDRSALIVLAYLVAFFSVSPQAAYNYVQTKRPVVSTKDIPMYWDFLVEEFNPPTLDVPDQSVAHPAVSAAALSPDQSVAHPALSAAALSPDQSVAHPALSAAALSPDQSVAQPALSVVALSPNQSVGGGKAEHTEQRTTARQQEKTTECIKRAAAAELYAALNIAEACVGQQLAKRRVEILMDGNCAYRAVSQGMFGTQEWFAWIRMLVAEYIRQHWDEIELFSLRSKDETIEAVEYGAREFLESGSQSTAPQRAWAGELELKSMAVSLDITLEVLDAAGSRLSQYGTGSKLVQIMYERKREHYTALDDEASMRRPEAADVANKEIAKSAAPAVAGPGGARGNEKGEEAVRLKKAEEAARLKAKEAARLKAEEAARLKKTEEAARLERSRKQQIKESQVEVELEVDAGKAELNECMEMQGEESKNVSIRALACALTCVLAFHIHLCVAAAVVL
jgi:hypothetical protein